jgi:hypothetical protein
LHSFNPNIVLSVLKKPERPSILDSTSSTSTIYSAENMRQVRTLISRVGGSGLSREKAKLGDFIKRITIENSILKV